MRQAPPPPLPSKSARRFLSAPPSKSRAVKAARRAASALRSPTRLGTIHILTLLALALIAPHAWPGPALAQTPDRPPIVAPDQDNGWNGRRVLGLVARARARRQQPVVDTTLRTYRADATGHVYFFIDREGQGEPVLLRADQVALELYWARPNRTKQVIRGMRSEEQFPIRDFRYYLDRYTVIQNGFGDEIRVGEGRDVANVPHPLAPGAESLYDYRLADSMTIRLPGAEPLRVYEVQVRPEDFGDRAIVGSLFLERARADLVRLAFTFTPSAYLDRRNERVEVTLENALWEGKYWLPREQRLLVRREIPELDLDVGTVIRAVLRVTDYELNAEIPPRLFDGREVVLAQGPDGLAAYDFEEGLFDGLDDVGLAPDAELGTLDAVDVEEIAGRILRQRFLRGVPRLRFYAPNASAILRYDRAEGLVTGAGLAYGLGEYQLTGYGGWAWGAEMPIAELAARPLAGSAPRWSFEGYYNRPVDLGARPAAAGLISSAAAAFLGEDYRDLYFESGVGIGREVLAGPRFSLALSGRAERHSGPRLVESHTPLDDDPFRPVLAIDDGDQVSLTGRGRLIADTDGAGLGSAGFVVEAGWFRGESEEGGRPFGTLTLDARRSWHGTGRDWGVELRPIFHVATNAPVQHGRLIGGRNTLPGHPFRAYYADRSVLADLQGWITVVPRWLRLRGLAAGAWIHNDGTGPVGEFMGSLGVGVAFVDGLLRVDYARGWLGPPGAFLDQPPGRPASPALDPGGAWIISIDPRLWGFL